MPTVRLPEESEHNEIVRKIDSMLREITKAPAMTQSVRAQGLRPSILMITQAELAHVMASRTILNQQKRMLALAVAAVKSAPYELYAHTHALQQEYGMATSEIVEIVATIAHVTAINLFENAIAIDDQRGLEQANLELAHRSPIGSALAAPDSRWPGADRRQLDFGWRRHLESDRRRAALARRVGWLAIGASGHEGLCP